MSDPTGLTTERTIQHHDGWITWTSRDGSAHRVRVEGDETDLAALVRDLDAALNP